VERIAYMLKNAKNLKQSSAIPSFSVCISVVLIIDFFGILKSVNWINQSINLDFSNWKRF